MPLINEEIRAMQRFIEWLFKEITTSDEDVNREEIFIELENHGLTEFVKKQNEDDEESDDIVKLKAWVRDHAE